ncbi:MAG: hypothetical protein HY867_13205 [Chloroflexi bacterium]|nr:hypothetical protein [Chloroflexota bacterium]
MLPSLTFHPLTPDRFADFERLFGSCGAYGGCFIYTGTLAAFQKAGFEEVARNSPTCPIVRFTIKS